VVYVLISSSRHRWENLRLGLRQAACFQECGIPALQFGFHPETLRFKLVLLQLKSGFQDGQTIRRAEFPLGPLLGCMEVDEPHFYPRSIESEMI
jgi:hypothetical protein